YQKIPPLFCRIYSSVAMKSRDRQPVMIYSASCPYKLAALGIDRLNEQVPDEPLRGEAPHHNSRVDSLMYCPSCSTHSMDGAKFCKSCGMNLSVITQALNGGVVISDPIRDREFKRARKSISDGIHGSTIGAALLVAAALLYFLIHTTPWIYPVALVLALGGIIKLFRSIGSIVDAKVGPKLLDPALQPRATGGLSGQSLAPNVRTSQRLSAGPVGSTRAISMEGEAGGTPISSDVPGETFARPMTGRINREHSSPLRSFDKDDDLMSKLRN